MGEIYWSRNFQNYDVVFT